MKNKKLDGRPIGRFPGEVFVLGLGICLAVQIMFGSAAAIGAAAVIGLVQVMLLRRQRLSGQESSRRLEVAEAEAKKWQERANTFMSELACYRDQVDYQDPETGVGSTRQFEVEFIKQVARFRRRNEPFSLALLQVRDPEHPEDQLDTGIIVAAAHRLAETARVEDSLCRVARRGFAVLLDGADDKGARVYINRARHRFEEAPITVSGRRVELALSAGVAQYNPNIQEVQEMLSAAARDLHRIQREGGDGAAQPAKQQSPVALRKAS
jgi:diguanylate cyclase (GGDEF)-like protein